MGAKQHRASLEPLAAPPLTPSGCNGTKMALTWMILVLDDPMFSFHAGLCYAPGKLFLALSELLWVSFAQRCSLMEVTSGLVNESFNRHSPRDPVEPPMVLHEG